MATSKIKQEASRHNGALSRGPKTPAGKADSSRNAVVHGILSRELILPSESADEYQALLGSLLLEMRPVGTLEQALVERIAVALWRQRRLVRAETAQIQLRVQGYVAGVHRKPQNDRAIDDRTMMHQTLQAKPFCDHLDELEQQLRNP